jgi:putative hemolysin
MMLELAVILLLILTNGVLAMAELAVVSSRRARLRTAARGGDHRAHVALALAEDPGRFLSTVQVGITLMGILAGSFGGATLAEHLAGDLATVPALAPYAEPMAFALVVAAITYLSLVIGELVPKRLALARPETIARRLAPAMRTLSIVASPLVHLLSASSNLVLRLLPGSAASEPAVTDEEVRHIMQQGLEAGHFHPEEKAIVEMTLRLGDRRVGALMTPRHQVEWLDLADPPEEQRRIVLEHRHARFPVFDGGLHRMIGVVEIRDLLEQALAGRPFDLRTATKPPLFIPDTAPALRALETFRQSGNPMAIIVDEYGEFEGVVTLTDLLEALVGEMPEAGAPEEPAVVRREDGSWLLDGMLPLDQLKDTVGLHRLPEEEAGTYHTLAGLVMAQLRRIPTAGDYFDLDGYRFEVVDMDGRRIDKVMVTERGVEMQNP